MIQHNQPSFADSQQGVVLFISLIVLVAMTLAGIAVTRSVDTGNVIAGNVAFKQGTIASGDRGIEAALTYLKTQATGGDLTHDDVGGGYFAVNASHSDWTDPDIWADAVTVPDASGANVDEAGNTVAYVIHRLCRDPGAAVLNCAQTSVQSASTQGSSVSTDAFSRAATPSTYYRISVRVQGPRETLSIVQTNVEIK